MSNGGRVSSPEVHAVVEVVRSECAWPPLSSGPGPQFVRLWHATPDGDVSLVLATLASYGRRTGTAASIEELLAEFPKILPGGFAVISSKKDIMPSCCCGLESWREWDKVVADGESPWTGHDPAPLVEVVGGQVLVWTDGAMGSKPANEVPIVFTTSDFAEAVGRAAADLSAFLTPLQDWLDARAPVHSATVVRLFKEAFL